MEKTEGMEKMKKNAKRKIGTSLLMSAIVAGSAVIPLANPKAEEAPNLKYSAHVENIGWQDMVGVGKYAGTEGKALRLEAIKVQRENLDGVELTFDVHVENEGWKNNLKETDVIGSEGKAQRLEAIRVRTKGLDDKGYKLQYKVHVEDIGWTDWTDEGKMAGTEGQAKRVEAIEFRLIKVADLKLENAKKDALTQLNKEYKAENYTINAKDFEAKMSAGIKAINDAKDVASVTSALSNVLTELGKIKSDTAELAGLDSEKNINVTAYITELNKYATAAKNAQVIKSAIESTRKAGTELIDNATSAGSVTTAKTTALENAVKAASTAAQTELDRLYKEGKTDATTGKVSYLKEAAYNTASQAIEAAIKNEVPTGGKALTNKQRVTNIVNAYTTAIATGNIVSFEDIAKEANDLLTTLETTVKGITLFQDNSTIKSALDKAFEQMKTVSTRDEISSTVQTTTSTVLSTAKSTAQKELDKLFNNGKAVNYKMLARSDYNTAVDAVKKVTDVNNIQDIANAVTTATSAATEVAGAKQAVQDLKDATADAKSDVSAIIKKAENIISQATTAREISNAKWDAEEAILASEKSYYVAEINKVVGQIDTVNKKYYRSDICDKIRTEINAASSYSDLATIYAKLDTEATTAYTEKNA